jgi:fimbrial chaperone protein
MSRCLLCGAALLALIATLPAHAASFTATPVRLTLPAAASSTSLSLQNVADQPVLVQAEVMAWSQRDGEDVLRPTEDLVVSPPIFTVAPGASQIVRIGLLQRPQSEREITYRVFLQEVPQPPPPGEQGISVALRLGLPVFVLPKGGASPQLSWTARREGGEVRVAVSNTGNGHAQIVECKLHGEDGKLIAERGLGAYVLAGQTRTWAMKTSPAWGGGKLTLSAKTSAGDVVAPIVAR